MKKKGGGRIAPEQFFAGPRQMGQQAGIVFNFEDIPKAPNTTLAHCLIMLTPEERQAEVIEVVYDAFFQYGRDVGDAETLLDIAAQLGLDADALRVRLADPVMWEQVDAEVQAAYRLGISSVPFFVINGKYAFSGAQPSEVILDILQQVTLREK